ncbi:MAG: anhydro-N-acetylmuramic acid kinase [Pseudomonadota bacterium]
MIDDSADALFVGLISGTSMDGIDAGVFSFADNKLRCLNGTTVPYPDPLRHELIALRDPDRRVSLVDIGTLDRKIGTAFADAAIEVIASTGLAVTDVTAIGSHGQTVWHDPRGPAPHTLQLGDPHTIAALTGRRVVADFRRADVAHGGEGAPLLPLLHDWIFKSRESAVAVLNLGGIANLTLLPPRGPISAFDTGPASTLMDQWLVRHDGTAFDANGQRAARGAVDAQWLDEMLADPYFARQPPKSTGFEYFNLRWLEPWRERIDRLSIDDVIATLAQLTVETIARDVADCTMIPTTVWVAGGGVHNRTLMQGLADALAPIRVAPLSAAGIDPDQLEAAGFAWLARERLLERKTRHAEVTGARHTVLLGTVVDPA